jgi:hypothetical protein
MAIPKLFEEEFLGRTEEHDLIHLWMNNENNQKDVIRRVINLEKNLGNELEKIVSWKIKRKEIEKPFFSGSSRFLFMIIDCLATVEITYESRSSENQLINNNDIRTKNFTFIQEYKPIFSVKVTKVLGQLNTYKGWLNPDVEYSKNIIIPVIVTFDNNTTFDNLIKDSGNI